LLLGEEPSELSLLLRTALQGENRALHHQIRSNAALIACLPDSGVRGSRQKDSSPVVYRLRESAPLPWLPPSVDLSCDYGQPGTQESHE